MKKNILIIVSAFILFGFSFALSSCKKCSKNEPGDGNTNNTPSDTKTSNATTDDPTSLSDDADGDCGGGDILTKEKERVLSELAKAASATVVVRGVRNNASDTRKVEKKRLEAEATLKEEMLKIEEAAKATESVRDPANTEIAIIANAIELLKNLAKWQACAAEMYFTDATRAFAIVKKNGDPAKKAY